MMSCFAYFLTIRFVQNVSVIMKCFRGKALQTLIFDPNEILQWMPSPLASGKVPVAENVSNTRFRVANLRRDARSERSTTIASVNVDTFTDVLIF